MYSCYKLWIHQPKPFLEEKRCIADAQIRIFPFFSNLLFYVVGVYLHVYVNLYVHAAHGGQKSVWNPLGVELHRAAMMEVLG